MTEERWQKIRGSRVTVPPHVVTRTYEGDTVALNIRTGEYYSIDSIGKRFLDVLQESSTLAGACTTLAETYGQPRERIQTDLAAFLDRMLELGLVELDGVPN